jgi:hypothetical protein
MAMTPSYPHPAVGEMRIDQKCAAHPWPREMAVEAAAEIELEHFEPLKHSASECSGRACRAGGSRMKTR